MLFCIRHFLQTINFSKIFYPKIDLLLHYFHVFHDFFGIDFRIDFFIVFWWKMAPKMVRRIPSPTTFLAPFSRPFPKIDFWMHFGRPLAPFWLPLAPFWLPFGHFWLHFGPFWPHFGPFWCHFGPLRLHFAPFWRHFAVLAPIFAPFSISALEFCNFSIKRCKFSFKIKFSTPRPAEPLQNNRRNLHRGSPFPSHSILTHLQWKCYAKLYVWKHLHWK